MSDFDADARKFVEKYYEPVEDKPGYVWFSKRNMQIISIDVLAAYLKKCYEHMMGRIMNGKNDV